MNVGTHNANGCFSFLVSSTLLFSQFLRCVIFYLFFSLSSLVNGKKCFCVDVNNTLFNTLTSSFFFCHGNAEKQSSEKRHSCWAMCAHCLIQIHTQNNCVAFENEWKNGMANKLQFAPFEVKRNNWRFIGLHVTKMVHIAQLFIVNLHLKWIWKC